jgi:hypothetical protein
MMSRTRIFHEILDVASIHATLGPRLACGRQRETRQHSEYDISTRARWIKSKVSACKSPRAYVGTFSMAAPSRKIRPSLDSSV